MKDQIRAISFSPWVLMTYPRYLGGFKIHTWRLKKKFFFCRSARNFCLYGPPNFDHNFWKNENFHKNRHIFVFGLKKPKKLFFSKDLLMYLLPCKYRYHTIISGKNIKEKKLVSKISFLGHLKILDLTEKKKQY